MSAVSAVRTLEPVVEGYIAQARFSSVRKCACSRVEIVGRRQKGEEGSIADGRTDDELIGYHVCMVSSDSREECLD